MISKTTQSTLFSVAFVKGAAAPYDVVNSSVVLTEWSSSAGLSQTNPQYYNFQPKQIYARYNKNYAATNYTYFSLVDAYTNQIIAKWDYADVALYPSLFGGSSQSNFNTFCAAILTGLQNSL
jgi:hypothetical protein